MSNNFNKYYDLIFFNKNYKREVSYILKKTRKIKVERILDTGCGTGTHSDLLYKSKKAKIFGLDTNRYLINTAKKKNPNIYFRNVDLKSIKEKNFDLVISMFNVVNYFKNLKKLIFFFKEIKNKTSKNSLFIFDAWNGSFNFKKTIVKEKRIIKNKNFILINHIKTIKNPSSKKVSLNYKIMINFIKKSKKINIKYKLIQFLWTPNEIKKALTLAGFKSVIIRKSFSNKSFTKKDLKLIFLAR